jgi:integrase
MFAKRLGSAGGDQSLEESAPGKNRNLALDKRLRRLFNLAGLPYKSAHKFRHGHAVYGLQHAQTMADYKAVSINLMHEDIKTTDEIYAPTLSNEIKDRIGRLNDQSTEPSSGELVETLAYLSNAELAQLMDTAAHRLAS